MRAVVLAAAAVALTVVGACSEEEPGAPSTMVDESPATSDQAEPGASSEPGSTGSNGDTSTAAIDPCSLIPYEEIRSLGDFADQPREDEGLGARSCGYLTDRSEGSTESGFEIGVHVRDEQGVASVDDEGTGVQQGAVNGRDAAKTSGPGLCIVALAVGDSARVDVGVTGTDEERNCEIAEKLADIVEPKLPEG